MDEKDIYSRPKEAEPEDWEWETEEEDPESSNKMSPLGKILAIIVVLGFLALSFPEWGYLLSDRLDFLSEQQQLSEDEIVRQARPAIVSIESRVWDGPFVSIHRGTGFNISPQGRVLTNRHVVEGAGKIKISFDDGRVFYPEKFMSINELDIAYIDLNSQDLPVIAVDIENKPEKGDMVTIIGNPLGMNKVSQRGQVGDYHWTQENQVPVFDIDVPANPGNSGSPVLNGEARAVGVVFASGQITTEGKEEARALAIPLQALPMKKMNEPPRE